MCCLEGGGYIKTSLKDCDRVHYLYTRLPLPPNIYVFRYKKMCRYLYKEKKKVGNQQPHPLNPDATCLESRSKKMLSRCMSFGQKGQGQGLIVTTDTYCTTSNKYCIFYCLCQHTLEQEKLGNSFLIFFSSFYRAIRNSTIK